MSLRHSGTAPTDSRHNIYILEESRELPIEQQLRKKWLQWFGHLCRIPDHQVAQQLLRCQPSGKCRKPGGTSQHWVDLISGDLSDLDNGQQPVQNRRECQSVVHGELAP